MFLVAVSQFNTILRRTFELKILCTLLSPAFILCASGALRLVQSIPSMCNNLGKWLERQVKKKVEKAAGDATKIPVWVQAGLPSQSKSELEKTDTPWEAQLILLHKQRDTDTAWIPSVAYWLKTVAGATSAEKIGTNVQTLYVAAFTFGGLSYTRTLLQAFDCTKNNDKLWYLDAEGSTPCMQNKNDDGTYSLSYDSFWACLLTFFLAVTFLAGSLGVRRIARGKEFVHIRTDSSQNRANKPELYGEPEFCGHEPLAWPTKYISLGWLQFALGLLVWMRYWHEIFSTVFVLLTLKYSGVWWMYQNKSIGIGVGTIIIGCWTLTVTFVLVPAIAASIRVGFAATLIWLAILLVLFHYHPDEKPTTPSKNEADDNSKPKLLSESDSKQQETGEIRHVLRVAVAWVCLVAIFVNYRIDWFGAGLMIVLLNVWLIGWIRLQPDRARCLKLMAMFIHRWQKSLEAKGGEEKGAWKHKRLKLPWGKRPDGTVKQLKLPSTERWQWWLFVSTLYLTYWVLPAYLWYRYILPTVPSKPLTLEERTKKHERIVLLASLGLTMYGIGLVRYWIELQRQGRRFRYLSPTLACLCFSTDTTSLWQDQRLSSCWTR